MKHTDLTKSVMDRIVTYESHRTRVWIGIFLAVFIFIAVLMVIIGKEIYAALLERHTLDVLEIVFQDREIIAEFWQDTLFVAWEEFPKVRLYMGLGLGAMLAVIWMVTKKRRKIVARRFGELEKKYKKRNNT